MMRRYLAISTVALIAVCCASGSSAPVPEGGEGPASPSNIERLDAYEAVIKHLAGAERFDWEKVYVQIPICANAGNGVEVRGCDDEFTQEEQSAIQQRFAGYGAPLEFVQSGDAIGNRIFKGKEQSIFVWLGPIQQEGDHLLVPGSMTCGGLCGTGSTWLLVSDADGWKVEGSAPGAAVWVS